MASYQGLCYVWAAFSYMCFFTSLLSLAAISFNRYIQICHPQRYQSIFTMWHTLLMCVTIWAVSFLVFTPTLYGWSRVIYDWKYGYCNYDRTWSFSFTLIMVGGVLLVVNGVILICYAKIYMHVRASKTRVAATDTADKDKKEIIHLIITLFVVYVVFVVNWTPYFLMVLIDYKDVGPTWLHLLGSFFAFSNSSMNSIIYGFLNKHFRHGYKKMLFICCPQRVTPITSTTMCKSLQYTTSHQE